jgi:biopolymer transport protein ExbD
MAGSQRSQDEYMSEINVTPLVDVMLVLLIVLMVAASFAVSKSLEVSLPKAATGTTESQPTTLVVAQNGDWSYNGTPTSESAFRQHLAALKQGGQEPHVIIAADGHTQHERVVHAMDFLRAEQVNRVSLAVTPAEM